MKGNEKTKCGVAGVGYLGQHHARIYDALESSDLVGVYEPNDEAASKVCEAYGCKRFEDLQDLGQACCGQRSLSDRLHAEVALPLIDKGCHLWWKNPLCLELGSGGDSRACPSQGTIVQSVISNITIR